jgi:hypothetical protein
MNYMSKTVVSDPDDADGLGLRFAKTSNHKKTIFLNLDDTLTHVSLYN